MNTQASVLWNQIFILQSSTAYSLIRKSDSTYRTLSKRITKFTNEVSHLVITPSALFLKHVLRIVNSKTTSRISEFKNVEVDKTNFIIFKRFHKELSNIASDLPIYDINQVPKNLSSTVKEINRFTSLMQEYEQTLRFKLYPISIGGVSKSEIMEQREKLEKFAEDWEDDNMDIYDHAYTS